MAGGYRKAQWLVLRASSGRHARLGRDAHKRSFVARANVKRGTATQRGHQTTETHRVRTSCL